MKPIAIAKPVVSAVLVLLGLGGIGTFGYTLTQQAQIQQRMDATMAQVNQSVAQTTKLVHHTSTILHPLTSTTAALAHIEKQQQSVVHHLSNMNQSLALLAGTEQKTILHLNTLNHTAQTVADKIQGLGTTNGNILVQSQVTAAQANSEASSLNTMNRLTKSASGHLQAINHRLAVLQLVP